VALVTFVVCGTGGADLRLTTSGAVSADPHSRLRRYIYIYPNVRALLLDAVGKLRHLCGPDLAAQLSSAPQ
jgi:hypothetical protein